MKQLLAAALPVIVLACSHDSELFGANGARCVDITAHFLANEDITLAGDSCVDVPAGTTQYDRVVSGHGTL